MVTSYSRSKYNQNLSKIQTNTISLMLTVKIVPETLKSSINSLDFKFFLAKRNKLLKILLLFTFVIGRSLHLFFIVLCTELEDLVTYNV